MMGDLIPYMKNMAAFRPRNAATSKEISFAESELHLHFSEEYKKYLSEYGVASVYGHEFTGIAPSQRLNVVSVTQEERALSMDINPAWYVIEQTNIDGIVIWQDQSGNIYQSAPSAATIKIASSMLEYLSNTQA